MTTNENTDWDAEAVMMEAVEAVAKQYEASGDQLGADIARMNYDEMQGALFFLKGALDGIGRTQILRDAIGVRKSPRA